MIYGKKQCGREGWWDDNLFLGIASVVIFSILFLVVGFSIKFGYRKAKSSIVAYQAGAQDRADTREARRLIKNYKNGNVQKKVTPKPKPVAKAPKKAQAVQKEEKWWSSDRQTYEEYCVSKPFKPWTKERFKNYNQDLWTAERLAKLNAKKELEHYQEWERENSNLMFDAYGELVDPIDEDNYTAEQTYWILALALWGVFVIWAGVGTGGNPIVMLFACLIGILGAIVVFCW
jgi:hypothetical protein